MEPQGRGSVSPLRTRRRNRALGLSKTTLRSRVHVQTVGLNAATKKDRYRAGRGALSLDIPFYRTCPTIRLIGTWATLTVGFRAGVWPEVLLLMRGNIRRVNMNDLPSIRIALEYKSAPIQRAAIDQMECDQPYVVGQLLDP